MFNLIRGMIFFLLINFSFAVYPQDDASSQLEEFDREIQASIAKKDAKINDEYLRDQEKTRKEYEEKYGSAPVPILPSQQRPSILMGPTTPPPQVPNWNPPNPPAGPGTEAPTQTPSETQPESPNIYITPGSPTTTPGNAPTTVPSIYR